LAHSQIPSRWVEKVARSMLNWHWHTTKSKDIGSNSSLDSCLNGLSTQPSLRVLGLAARVGSYPLGLSTMQSPRRWVWQFARLMFAWAWHVAKSNDVRFDSTLDTCPIRLGIMPSLREVGLEACEAHVCLGLPCNRV
jgi:hypothetical protein